MQPQQVLVLGGGGREHALAWKLAQSPRVEKVWVAPGNAGTAREPRVENVPINPLNAQALTEFAQQTGIGLTPRSRQTANRLARLRMVRGP